MIPRPSRTKRLWDGQHRRAPHSWCAVVDLQCRLAYWHRRSRFVLLADWTSYQITSQVREINAAHIYITNLSHLWWIISDKPSKKASLCFLICLVSRWCETRWMYSSLFSFVTATLDPLGMRSVVFVIPNSDDVLARRKRWEASHTVRSDCKIQRQIFQITVIVLQENQAVVELWIKWGKIIQETLAAEPLYNKSVRSPGW